MSILLKNLKPRQLVNAVKVLSAVQGDGVRKCHWYPSYTPDEYPNTKEEREKAAKKYNLLPEEYDPYSNDGNSCGDYPNLPKHSEDSRDPWHTWDYPDLKRDFNQAIPFEEMHLLHLGISTGPENDVWDATIQFLGFLGVTGATLLLLLKIKNIVPISEKQLIAPGVTHFTFELENDHH